MALKGSLLAFVITASLALGVSSLAPAAFAQVQSGGVDKEGSWYVGENLAVGDFFSYELCHVDYKECSKFRLDMWIRGDIQVKSEAKWLADVVVYDGDSVINGTMHLGKIVPEPTGGSDNLKVSRAAFGSSVAWLSAFATPDIGVSGKGPKEFSAPSWGKIANIGGEQILPSAIERVAVPAGVWEDSVLIQWKTGGYVSSVWVADDFPFPIKAHTLTHVSSGIPPTEYKFELLDYRQGVTQNPFEDIEFVSGETLPAYCERNFDRNASIKRSTVNFDYMVHVSYGPDEPMEGCEIQWLIKFLNKFDQKDFLNRVQFDFLVVDDAGSQTRSIAVEDGKRFLYSPSGQYLLDMPIKEPPGDANYVILIYGTAPQDVVPSSSPDYLQITVPIYPRAQDADGEGDGSGPAASAIPAWIRGNAGWWADGSISDDTFIQGIQYLINNGIMRVPPAGADGGTGVSDGDAGGGIPSWVKGNAGWWADGSISDDTFIQGIQYLIGKGIIRVSPQ